jgi:hypothetical protein
MPEEYTIAELKAKVRMNTVLFYAYLIASVVMICVGGHTVNTILGPLLSMGVDASTKLLLLFGVFGVINFFLIFWVWLTSESSYYRMEQRMMELMVYLRSKEFED